MENLYKSLYDDINPNNDKSFNFELSVINKISGQYDVKSLSKYYNFDEYDPAINLLGDNYFSIIHVNIRSLHKNFESLRSFLTCLPKLPDAIAITETCSQDHTKHLYSVEGYSPVHLVRTNRQHGGITIYSKDMFNVEILHQFSFITRNIEIFTFVVLNLLVKKS